MRLHRFIISIPLQGETIEVADQATIKQISKVLRLTVSDHLIVSDGAGTTAEVEITALDRQKLTGKIISRETAPKPHDVRLYVSMPKRSLFETIVEGATELGATHITPIICERTVKTGSNHERALSIAKEAAETAGRSWLPTIAESTAFGAALREAVDSGANLFLCDESGVHFRKNLTEKNPTNIALFIGPEGGFTPEEIKSAELSGATVVALGSHTLRIEIAALAALATLL